MKLRKILGIRKEKKDDVLDFLKERHDRFIEKIKNQNGFNSLEEYQLAGKELHSYQFTKSFRYPVHSDC